MQHLANISVIHGMQKFKVKKAVLLLQSLVFEANISFGFHVVSDVLKVTSW